MSADTSVRWRRTPATGWLASPPPSVAIEIAPSHVTVLALAESGREASIVGYAIEPLAAGVVTAALNAPNVHDQAALAATIKTALQKVAARAQPRGAGHSRHDRQGLARPVRQGAGQGAGPRPADSLAGQEGRAVPGRGRAGVLGAGHRDRRRRPRVRRVDGAAGRDSELRARVRGRRRARGPHRHRQLQPHQRADGRDRPVGRRTGCWCTSRPTTPRSPSCGAATSCSSATVRSAPRVSSRTSSTRRRCTTKTGWAAAASRASCSPARRWPAPSRPSACGAAPRSEIGGRVELFDVRAAATMRDRISASPGLLDALAAPVGVLLRERPGRVEPGGWRDAAHQPVHASLLQRARRPPRDRPRGPGRRSG